MDGSRIWNKTVSFSFEKGVVWTGSLPPEKWSSEISISRAIRTNTWKFAEFANTLGTMKLEKGKNRD